MGAKKYSSLAALIVAYLSVTAGQAQTTGTGADYLKQSLTGGFIYELKVGPNFGWIHNAPGFAAQGRVQIHIVWEQNPGAN